jgi:hypothetical protein
LLNELGDCSDLEFVQALFDRSNVVWNWLAEIVVMGRGVSERCVTVIYERLMHDPFEMMFELSETLWPGWDEARLRVEQAVRESIRQGYAQRATYLRRQAVGVGGWETWLTREQSERLDHAYQRMRQIAEETPRSRAAEVARIYRTERSS